MKIEKKTPFDTLKTYNGKVYKGMKVGGNHEWNYLNTEWEETKTEPDRWNIRMTSIKHRKTSAPEGSGAPIGTIYDWFIIGRQVVKKINKDEYQTILEGHKYKIGYMKENWQRPSYEYKGQKSMKQQQIEALNREIKEIMEIQE